MAKIRKPFVTWQEFWALQAGSWNPSAHTLASHSSKAHSELTGVTSDLHHAQSHTLASHSTKPHSALTDVLENQHHNKLHSMTGVAHSAAGLTIGHVIKATGATTFAWGQLPHDKLAGLGDDDHAQYLLASGARALSAHWDAGSYQIRALKFYSDQATGTAPFTVLSTTKVNNLNVCRVDDLHASSFALTTRKLDDFGEPDDNIDLNVSIARHGLFPKLSNHPAECLSGIGQWLRLYDSTSIIIGILSVTSTTTRNGNFDVRATDNLAWTKLKETKLGEPTGKMKIYFEMKGLNATGVYGRIYKNGVAIGTSRFTLSTSYQIYSQDLGGFNAQDLIQVYAYCQEAEDLVYIRNLTFRYSRSINILGEHTLTTPIAITWQSGDEFSMQNQDP